MNPLSLQASAIPANCGSNGSAQVLASGGSGSFQYLWSDSQTTTNASNLFPGTYQVRVVDSISGCADSISALVGTLGGITAFVDTTTAVSCFGASDGNANLAVSGQTGSLSYSWTDLQGNPVNPNALAAGDYRVTVTDAGTGCAAQALFNIPQPAPLNLQILNIDEGNCEPDSASAMVNAFGGNGPFTYSWTTNPPQTGATASQLPAGSYAVTVTDQNNCSAQITVTINCPLPLDEFGEKPSEFNKSASDFEMRALYPNPTDDQLHIDLWLIRAGGVRVQLFDMKGRTVMDWKFLLQKGEETIRLSLGEFAEGIYEVVLGFEDGTQVNVKVFHRK